jgi:malic enzyme
VRRATEFSLIAKEPGFINGVGSLVTICLFLTVALWRRVVSMRARAALALLRGASAVLGRYRFPDVPASTASTCFSSISVPPTETTVAKSASAAKDSGRKGVVRGEVTRTRLRRLEVIHDPHLNRGTAFSADERERLGIRGLVPPRMQPLEQQIERIYAAFKQLQTPLDRFQFCSMLMDRNTVLFYVLFIRYFTEIAPIVYTPTVGEACQKFHAIYRRTRGMYFSLEDRGNMLSMVYNWPEDKLDVIVVTDGSRVLGLGDLGANSANIPIGKVSLYVAGGGINPRRSLPVVLDAGTDNEELRNNALYLGIPVPRLKGEEYFEFVDEWMRAVRTRWPNVLVQFEDFNNATALPLLQKYRASHLCFNDDVQSTGTIATAAVLASLKTRGMSPGSITGERIVCLGAGSAGLGVCNAIVRAMTTEGLSESEAHSRFILVDDKGAVGTERGVGDAQRPFATSIVPDGTSLLDTVNTLKPTVLLGLSGVGGLFTEEVVRAAASHVERPVILPLSNPSSRSECTAEQAFAWTDGRAVFASGSPFPDVELGNGLIGATNQCNNVYSFPGLGLAVTALGVTHVTDSMFHAAAVRIAELAGEEQLRAGRLFPPVENLRAVSAEVAAAIGRVALNEKLATKLPPEGALTSRAEMVKFMRGSMWEPRYSTVVAE